jgi:site-specific DNA recombinase
MPPLPTAIEARVSSAQPAEAQTVARHVAAWRERVAAAARPCIDEGDRGATRVRPALARRRDLAAAGAADRRDVHSPDRLARPDASHVLLVEAFPHAGVAVSCVHREVGQRPADDRRRPGPGRRAEEARAPMIARQRRGTRHAARAGPGHVRRGAPEGEPDLSP